MKRWALVLVLFATPLSSPMACGGDGCLRNSDCHADQMCDAGQCVLTNPPHVGSGGEGGEDSSPATAGTNATSGSGGKAGSSGSAGKSTNEGGEMTTPTGGDRNTDTGGAAGAGGESPVLTGDGGLGGAVDVPLGGALP